MSQPYPPHEPRGPQRPYAPPTQMPQRDPRSGYAPQQEPWQGAWQQQSPPPPAPKKRRKWPLVLLAFVVLSIGGFVACTAAVGSAVKSVSAPVTVRYELAGSGDASTITYSTGAGVSQESTADLPWKKSVTFDNGFLAGTVLSAQNGDKGGNLTCKIVNETTGATIAEGTSSGQYAVVSCQGTPTK